MEGLDLPRRLPTTHLAFLGRRPVVISEARGRRLRIELPPEDPRLAEALGFLHVLLGRESQPLRTIDVEQINGAPAPSSPYAGVLAALFHIDAAPSSLRISRRL